MSRVVYESEKRITNKFGNGHEGIDIGYRENEEENKVFSLTDGVVIQAVDFKDQNLGSTGTESYGNFIMIKHDGNLESTYAHLKKGSVCVKIGDHVTKDTQIAIVGETGNAYGRHLHLRVKKNGALVDPTLYLNAELEKTATKSIDQIAQEVIAGKWDNGQERKEKLSSAGYNYADVQNKVNQLLSNSNNKVLKSIESIAREVIAGKWGNGQDRKKKLTEAGYDYNKVQSKVNELLK